MITEKNTFTLSPLSQNQTDSILHYMKLSTFNQSLIENSVSIGELSIQKRSVLLKTLILDGIDRFNNTFSIIDDKNYKLLSLGMNAESSLSKSINDTEYKEQIIDFNKNEKSSFYSTSQNINYQLNDLYHAMLDYEDQIKFKFKTQDNDYQSDIDFMSKIHEKVYKILDGKPVIGENLEFLSKNYQEFSNKQLISFQNLNLQQDDPKLHYNNIQQKITTPSLDNSPD